MSPLLRRGITGAIIGGMWGIAWNLFHVNGPYVVSIVLWSVNNIIQLFLRPIFLILSGITDSRIYFIIIVLIYTFVGYLVGLCVHFGFVLVGKYWGKFRGNINH